MIAFDFLVLEGFRDKKNYWVDPPARQTGTPAGTLTEFLAFALAAVAQL